MTTNEELRQQEEEEWKDELKRLITEAGGEIIEKRSPTLPELRRLDVRWEEWMDWWFMSDVLFNSFSAERKIRMELLDPLAEKPGSSEGKKKGKSSNKNRGEKDEVLVLRKLYRLNEREEYDKLVEIFGEEASEGISILNIETDEEIDDINKISKAGCNYKADCKIRMKKTNNIYAPSIKSFNGRDPSILNHTPRSAKIFQEGGIFNDLVSCLDKILQEYIFERTNKTIGQDIPISNLKCLKDDDSLKKTFSEILLYFVFNGTGKQYSKCKSDAIITYHDDKIIFTKCDNIQNKKEYIESIFDKIVISLRNKGMPKVLKEYCKPWVFNDVKPDGSIKHKGSLHIRMRK